MPEQASQVRSLPQPLFSGRRRAPSEKAPFLPDGPEASPVMAAFLPHTGRKEHRAMMKENRIDKNTGAPLCFPYQNALSRRKPAFSAADAPSEVFPPLPGRFPAQRNLFPLLNVSHTEQSHASWDSRRRADRLFSRRGNNDGDGPSVHLSRGNTEIIAEKLQPLTGGELFRPENVNPYAEDYRKNTEAARRELQQHIRPD